MTNFIFIVADDLGYADLGCYGGRVPVSPVLDSLAARGVRYVNGYSNSPVCSPTRFALMTGRYQYWVRGASEEPMTKTAAGNPNIGLFPDLPTLPSMLKAVGYHTALIGKWHLGFPPHFGPLKSGYDTHFGPMSGGVGYYTHRARGHNSDLEQDGHSIEVEGYLTDLISERAVHYVKSRAGTGKPFMLSLHYTAPHWPWETRTSGPNADAARNIAHLDGGNVQTYHQMIREMDEGIGWVIEALRETGQLDDTFIVFTSDNGGERFSDNWPLVGGKMDLTEGGIRVPYIVHWPRGLGTPGVVSAQHCMTMDWTATILDIADAKPPVGTSLDGQSMLANLKNPAMTWERRMYWRMKHRGQRALRVGPWKYLRVDGHDYLFDVDTDARERANLKHKQPERLDRMRALWEQWASGLPAIPPEAYIGLVYTDADMPAR
jgi:arylsulfatase A-like enzyme